MRPTQHPSNNGVLGAPKETTQEELPCSALAITRHEQDGIPYIISFWQPSKEELEILKAGGTVGVWVVGHTTPPLSLTAEPRA